MITIQTDEGLKPVVAVYVGTAWIQDNYSGTIEVQDNYSAEMIVDTIYDKNGNTLFSAYNEVNGISPLSFRSKTNNSSTLKNYRIYGNTVSDESVGDKTENLFDGTLSANTGLAINTGLPASQTGRVSSGPIPISSDSVTITYDSDDVIILYSVLNGDVLVRRVAAVGGQEIRSGDTLDTSTGTLLYICFYKYRDGQTVRINPSDISNIMLNSGSTALPYEPYGYKVPVKVEGKNLYDINSTETINAYVGSTLNYGPDYVSVVFPCEPNTTYTITKISSQRFAVGYITGRPENGKEVRGRRSDNYNTRIAITTDNSADYLVIWVYNAQYDTLTSNEILSTLKIVVGSYTPIVTNIYLPEQIKKVGDEAEYIDFKEQKQYYADGTSTAVTLPALDLFAGTNVLTVETEVQPSKVYVKGKIEEVEST